MIFTPIDVITVMKPQNKFEGLIQGVYLNARDVYYKAAGELYKSGIKYNFGKLENDVFVKQEVQQVFDMVAEKNELLLNNIIAYREDLNKMTQVAFDNNQKQFKKYFQRYNLTKLEGNYLSSTLKFIDNTPTMEELSKNFKY